MNKFYIYYDCGFIRITEQLSIRITHNNKRMSYWTSKRSAKTWESAIKKKFPKAKLIECQLKPIL